jgi:hypothetical protein
MVEAWPLGARYQFPLISTSTVVDSGQVLIATTSGPTPPAGRAAECPPAGTVPPPGAVVRSSAEADLDGDGHREQVRIWTQDTGGTTSWSIGAALGQGSVVAAMPAPGTGLEPARYGEMLMGAADANDRPGDEVFVKVDQGAYTEQFHIWGLDGCTLVPVRPADAAETMTLSVGASAQHKAGVWCTYSDLAARLVVYTVDAVDNGLRAAFTDHIWNGLTLAHSGGPNSFVAAEVETWFVNHASNLRCGVPTLNLTYEPPVGGPEPPTPAPGGSASPPAPVPARPNFTG